ncbi:RNA polymerase sigma-70 factor [Parapedobacter tibetensis]|uniref:RNA polymerase sigma-70 factor n=1 Tax=Parapedobacter tibetensis TaxID=2972951 RepID=UPI00214DA3F8|nr:RNA polymerase sigma-70 factor [Parapedobacter tibetensis]
MKKMTMVDWKTVAKNISNGDIVAFRQCFDSLRQDIYRYAMAYFRSCELAEDTVQDVFTTLWANRQSIDVDLNLKAYIYRIARNIIFNQLKRATYDQRMRNIIFQGVCAAGNEIEEGYFYEELNGLYQEAIDKLPPQRQLVFTMSRNEGVSHDEIAQRLALSKNTVKDQIVKASRFIRNYISKSMAYISTPLLLLVNIWLGP